jgi:GT2 family glycosyltransferase
MTRLTWANNLNNAGFDYDLFWFDNGTHEDEFHLLFDLALDYRITWVEYSKENIGIAKALNKMIRTAFARGADYVMTMANDIIEPDNWLSMRIEAANKIANTGVVAITVQGGLRYDIKENEGIRIDAGQVIGNYLITRQAYDNVGLFCQDYDPYGPIDLDYCDRCLHSGLRTYYLSDHNANHLGRKEDNPKKYQDAKDAALRRSWAKYASNKQRYRKKEYLYQMY